MLLPGNHDHPQRLRSCLGRHALVAPCRTAVGNWTVIGLDTHLAGQAGGALGPEQLHWLATTLATCGGPCLVATHHPPVPIGCSRMDAMDLMEPHRFLQLLARFPQVKGVLFGHVHQAWDSQTPLRLLACPSTLLQFGPVQPCGNAHQPGWRLLQLRGDGHLATQVVRLTVQRA